MAKLWADQIIDGKRSFAKVPRLLKEAVKLILLEKDRGDLIVE